MSEPSRVVFLSYASQDAEAAKRICGALRAAGIEVFLDQSELRGGDAWDQSIRRQIKTCALFLPVISKNTHERVEGYFRLEWKLAVDRCHLMAADKAFLVPLAIDETPDDDERVPERFREVQWTRLPRGEPSPGFVARIDQLLSGGIGSQAPAARRAASTARRHPSWVPRGLALAAVGVAVAAAGAYLVLEKPWSAKTVPTGKSTEQGEPAVAFAPPAHSIAVLPFSNLSGDPKQEYFSDGISEELINALSHIESLQVIARTSSFSFKGRNVDIATIARKLNVAAVLEGSIRRDRNRVRITVQLIDTLNGFHIWSEDYDRNLDDTLSLQSEIATTVAQQLRARLLSDEVARIEVGGTRRPQAYDAYLRAEQMFPTADSETKYRRVVAAFDEAIGFDPDYAAAYAGRAVALIDILVQSDSAGVHDDVREQARSSAERAVALAPDYAYAHGALWFVRALGFFDFKDAAPEVERAVALDPGNARIQQFSAVFNSWLGHADRAIEGQRRAVLLDPRSYRIRYNLAQIFSDARRYEEAQSVLAEAEAINPDGGDIPALRASILNALGRPQQARSLCNTAPNMREAKRHWCLAVALHALGDLEGAEREFALLRTASGNNKPFEYAEIDAQWARPDEALRWLGVAERTRDPGLQKVRASWALDPLRNLPAFKAFEQGLNWPP